MADHEPMMDVACGDPELSEELRDALALLRDRSDNDDFRTLVDDVLAGRCSLFEASGTAAFNDVVFARIAQEFDELTEDEKPKDEKRSRTGQAGSSGPAAASCGIPCAGCPGICAAPGTG
ncbi:MAG TPA: hypothetical protein VK887_05100 [Pseudonocardiaceae bacterium]|nr:hypothetical protein [Pseudonocardiaceae bacterium]